MLGFESLADGEEYSAKSSITMETKVISPVRTAQNINTSQPITTEANNTLDSPLLHSLRNIRLCRTNLDRHPRSSLLYVIMGSVLDLMERKEEASKMYQMAFSFEVKGSLKDARMQPTHSCIWEMF